MIQPRFFSLCNVLYIGMAVAPTVSYTQNNTHRPAQAPFTENKGQISDQYRRPRPDVLFSGKTGNMVYHLRADGISYQLSRVETWKEEKNTKTGHVQKIEDQNAICRLDIDWLGINDDFLLQKEGAGNSVSHYYSTVCPDGVTDVKSYHDVYYNRIYDRINLHYYQKEGALKYDYIVLPGGDYRNIRLRVKGARSITVQNDGSLRLETPFGVIEEGAPLVYQNGRRLFAKWELAGDVLEFAVEEYDPLQELIIDPVVRVWGTYAGGTGVDFVSTCAGDTAGNVYVAGWTRSLNGIATTGAYITTWSGNSDGFIQKFDRNGVLQWGTYYAGTGEDKVHFCTTDTSGNVYITGETSSTEAVLTSPGCHQPTYGGGGMDGFLAKLNGNGVRQWGTFYGGTVLDYGFSCNADKWGNVYMAGTTRSTSGIATPGSHLATSTGGNKAYLVKFDPDGNRLWGTYYGRTGPMNGSGLSTCTDISGNVFMSGTIGESSQPDIATPGSHQPAHAGGMAVESDAFLVKFDPNGVRQWGTFYGGNGVEDQSACVADTAGNVYLFGSSSTSAAGTSIATPGSYQPAYGGGTFDAFLAKFNAAGVRQWGTYYGGSGNDYGYSAVLDDSGDVYLAGITSSDGVMAPAGSHQTVRGGGFDGYLVKFNRNGDRRWGTYYGGSTYDYGEACALGDSGNVYLAGYTESQTGIATPGSHKQTIVAGDGDGYVAKFKVCDLPPLPVNTTPPAGQLVCYQTSALLSASGLGTLGWYSQAAGGNFLGNGPDFATPLLTADTTFYVQDSSYCGAGRRLAVLVTVKPQVQADVLSQTDVSCRGGNNGAATVSAQGGTPPYGYYWIPGGDTAATLTGLTAGAYACVVTDTAGCIADTVHVTITEPAAIAFSQTLEICHGNSVQVGNHMYSVSGTYVDTLLADNGCDSTVTTVLEVRSAITYTQSLMVCKGQSVTVGTHTYNSTGIYVDVLAAADGCDSTVTTDLTVHLVNVATSVSGLVITAVTSGAVYQWLDCSDNLPLPGATTQNFTATQNGAYAVQVTQNGCVDTSACVTVSQVGILENAGPAATVKLYPNPTSAFVYIQADVEIRNVEVSDVSGKKYTVPRTANTLDFSQPASGVYLVRIIDHNGHETLFRIIRR